MALFNSDSKQQKNNLIALQNIVLEINEKKLQVSEEFLDKMTKIYISKNLKIINENLSSLSKVTNIGLLFRKYDLAMETLENLIIIEPLHKFSKPTPTEYKLNAEKNLEKYIMGLIGREWRKLSPQSAGNMPNPDSEMKIRAFLASFDDYLDRLPDKTKETLDQIRRSAFPDEFKEAEVQLNDLATDVGEFIPETFETFEHLPDDGAGIPDESAEQQ